MTVRSPGGMMTGGEAVVRALIDGGIDTIFGLPGIQNDWLYNALYDARDRVRVIHTRHEQGAAYMALGYALASGKVGVYNVVPGPGFLNTTAALCTAYALNAPVFCLTGQIPRAAIGRGTGVLHEIPDQLGVMRSLTKWAARAETPLDAAALVAEALRQLRSGRPRPVGLEIPMDVLAERVAVRIDQEGARNGTEEIPASAGMTKLEGASAGMTKSDGASEGARPRSLDSDAIDRAARLLGAAQRPMIWVGSGAQGVSREVRQLAEALQAPVVAYRTGRGVLDSRHYLSMVQPQAHALWQTVDVVLAVGTNMRVPLQNWGTDEALATIRVDVDPSSHDTIHSPTVAITARAEDALPALIERLTIYNIVRASREDEMKQVTAAWYDKRAFLQPQIEFLDVIRAALGEDGIFVDELTQIGFAARVLMPVYHPRTFISTGYQGTLGYGFQTALGVKVARPNVPVISVTGDGGFLFGVQELATAVQHGIALITIVFNNNQYGNVRAMQRDLYDNRVIASDLHNPDFPRLAESFGAAGYRAETPVALAHVLDQAMRDEAPALIEVPVSDMPDVDRFRKLPRVRGLSR